MSSPAEGTPAGDAPWLDAALRERLGPDATTGTLVFEGRILRARGARLPLGPALLEVEEATIELGAGSPVGRLPLLARLVSLRGELRAPGVILPIAIEPAEGDAPGWVHGRVRVQGATIRGAPSPLDIEGPVEVGPDGWSLALASAQSSLALVGSIDAPSARLTGKLAFADVLALDLLPGAIAPRPVSAMDLDLVIERRSGEPKLHGRVFAEAVLVGLRAAPADAPACRVERVSVAIDADRRRLRYRDLAGSLHGGRFRGAGRIPFASGGASAEPLAALEFEGVGAPLLIDLAALAGLRARLARAGEPPAGEVWVPEDLALGGAIAILPDLAASGSLTLVTPRTDLRVGLALAADRSLVGSTVRGKVALADALALGIFPRSIRPRPVGRARLDARLTGTAARPGLAGRFACRRIELALGESPSLPALMLDEVSAVFDARRDRVAWQRLTGRFAGGTFASSGLHGVGPDFVGLHLSLGWSGVRVEQIPTRASGESRIGRVVVGSASGEIHVRRVAGSGRPIEGKGHTRIEDPRYPFTESLKRTLARYGLPPLSSRGSRPFEARLRIGEGAVTFEPLAAGVTGADVEGGATLGFDGRLGGRVLVHLEEMWLARSPLLAIPALFAGRITVPIELGGTVFAPLLEAEALDALERMLGNNRLSDAVRSALGDLRAARSRRR